MKKKLILSVLYTALMLSFDVLSLQGQFLIDLEAGAAGTGYNDVRIPGDQGTRFSLKDDLTPKTEFYYRIRTGYTIKNRHTLSLLYSPFETVSTGIVPKDILFEGVTFPANSDLTGTYNFNSYRLTYRYEIVTGPKLEFGLGFTAKIRDARIALASAGLESEKVNVGFVPIINFRMLWKPYEKLGILVEGDALAAPQGRAEDVLVAATYRISDHIGLKAGYRLLEGGADNAEVYNFALFHFATAGIFIYL